MTNAMFSFLLFQSIVAWKHVMIVRIVIHQPSSPLVWKQFTIQNIIVYPSTPSQQGLFVDYSQVLMHLVAYIEKHN